MPIKHLKVYANAWKLAEGSQEGTPFGHETS